MEKREQWGWPFLQELALASGKFPALSFLILTWLFIYGWLSDDEYQVCVECFSKVVGSCTDCRLPVCQKCTAIHAASTICDQLQKLPDLEVRDLVEFTAPLRLYNAFISSRRIRRDLSCLMDHNPDEVNPSLPHFTTLWHLNGFFKEKGDSISWQKAKAIAHSWSKTRSDETSAYEDVLRCVGVVRTNALDLFCGKGRVVFPFFSFLSHSCINNAVHVIDKDKNMRYNTCHSWLHTLCNQTIMRSPYLVAF